MKKENNSFSLVQFFKNIFKSDMPAQKNGHRKREPRWMYRND